MIRVSAQDFAGAEKGKWHMNTISKEYLLLFNAMTDAEEALRQLRERLIDIQRQAEELYLEETDAPAVQDASDTPLEAPCCICP